MKPQIKIDLEKIINNGEPLILDLGCGTTKKEGRLGIDKLNFSCIDIVTDLENGLPFLPDNSVDEIHSRSLFEHINNFEHFMREIVRVLKNDGRCYLFVPHFSNPYYYSDYTHSKFFGLYTFYYFADNKYQLKRRVPNFYTNIRIKILSQHLVFTSPFISRKLFKKLLGMLFNSHYSLQEFYEENLCYFFPCYGIKVVFTPDK